MSPRLLTGELGRMGVVWMDWWVRWMRWKSEGQTNSQIETLMDGLSAGP